MAKQTINLGTAPTGAGGDDERGAFTKVNANFDEIYAGFGGSIPAGSAASAPIVGSTSAIFQRGSVANGEYIRYQDGTQICWNLVVSGTYPANAVSTGTAITFPVAFANTGYAITAAYAPTVTYDCYGVNAIQPLTASTANIYIRNGATAQAFHIRYIAIGRWK